MMVRNFLRDPADPLGMAEGAEDAIRARAREASPVNHLDRADPPLLLIQGGKDSLCASAQARDMAAAAMKAGTEVHLAFYPEIGHVPTDPDVFRTSSRFMDRHLGTSCSAFFDSIWPIEQVVATATEQETKE
jgi:dipeptidyl aminopeptidase/acylaminoacyl peptidase